MHSQHAWKLGSVLTEAESPVCEAYTQNKAIVDITTSPAVLPTADVIENFIVTCVSITITIS